MPPALCLKSAQKALEKKLLLKCDNNITRTESAVIGPIAGTLVLAKTGALSAQKGAQNNQISVSILARAV